LGKLHDNRFTEHDRETNMKSIWAKFLALVLVAGSAFAMVAVSFDAEARRFGGGFSSGRQSINVLKQKQATVPSAAARAGRRAH
jgi:hypothetical protein